ncbi:MAG: gliding motility-associated protein GldE [Chitinophagales bacterium]
MDTQPPDAPSAYINEIIFSTVLAEGVTGDLLLYIVAILILLTASALISGSEVAYFSLTANELKQLKQDSTASAHKALEMLLKPRYLLATILIGNNLVNVAIIVISYFIFNTLLIIENEILQLLVNLVGVTFVMVVYGEVTPKIYATRFNLKLAKFMAFPLYFMRSVFKYPIGFLLVRFSSFIEKKINHKNSGEIDKDELEKAIDLATGAKADAKEIDMLKGIVKFGNINVRQIMHARVNVFALDISTPYSELLREVEQAGFSRIPVFEDSIDKIVGVLYVKDLLDHLEEPENFEWQKLLRPPFFVPESKKINDLLREIQENGVHLAVVVDEYGGTEGIITLEDIVEEITGEIKDEYDEANEIDYVKIDNFNYEFEGKTLLNDIIKVLKLRDDVFDNKKGESESLAGLILEIAGRIPKAGESIHSDTFKFTVLSVQNNRIERVKITLHSEPK